MNSPLRFSIKYICLLGVLYSPICSLSYFLEFIRVFEIFDYVSNLKCLEQCKLAEKTDPIFLLLLLIFFADII